MEVLPGTRNTHFSKFKAALEKISDYFSLAVLSLQTLYDLLNTTIIPFVSAKMCLIFFFFFQIHTFVYKVGGENFILYSEGKYLCLQKPRTAKEKTLCSVFQQQEVVGIIIPQNCIPSANLFFAKVVSLVFVLH